MDKSHAVDANAARFLRWRSMASMRRAERARMGRTSIRVAPADVGHHARMDWLHRAFDIAVSLGAIIALLPLFPVLALLIKLTSRGPVLFRQRRVGRNGALFPCLKFRSMVVNSPDVLEKLLASDADARAEWARDQKLRNDPRITWIGSFLRRSSLDELPQLFNIFAGQMSIVGPRPILPTEVVRYGPRIADYCSVRPGLTGLWQVNGRNDLSYPTRVRLDAFYSFRKSVVYDFGICLRTIPALLARRGSY
ncbi:sugar transferase [Novosphingobium sp. KCTC 2891]|uniref:sugar transferase n=1 Tax=Novosphingobium sp. KCTC 2891 TaxID=2989730 RepID=UPI0022228410|nr:sugar transferase [Novosphingobium sp. KCTC 2891]MCW1382703.1 sugar transferase [Novosphingobium sp. KCTC 2891]